MTKKRNEVQSLGLNREIFLFKSNGSGNECVPIFEKDRRGFKNLCGLPKIWDRPRANRLLGKSV